MRLVRLVLLLLLLLLLMLLLLLRRCWIRWFPIWACRIRSLYGMGCLLIVCWRSRTLSLFLCLLLLLLLLLIRRGLRAASAFGRRHVLPLSRDPFAHV